MERSEPDVPEDQDRPASAARPARRVAGGVLGAAMLGLHTALFGPPKEPTIVEIESSGDPPNLDTDGLHELLADGSALVGPPLDEIKAKATGRRKARPRPRR